MKSTAGLVLVFACTTLLAAPGPKGTVPKASSTNYARHVEYDGVSVGATLLTPEQARKTFVSDVNRCCAIVELAFYPPKGKAFDLSLNDFVLRVIGTDTAAKPSSAKVVAASLQKKAAKDRDIAVSPTVGVGYGNNGYDPVTGRNGGGVYQQMGVNVGVGNGGPNPPSTDKDRSAMEAELSEKGVPEGTTSAPVAGYLYFPVASRKKGTAYQLEYTINGQKVLLALP
jgi:hypothetical protein